MRDHRARHAIENHAVKVGLKMRAAVLGGQIGYAEVTKVADEICEFSVSCDQAPPPRTPLHLVVAVPRPHLVRKTLQFAAMVGVEKLTFVRTKKVVPSYLQSKSLQAREIEAQILNGLEQACDCIAPEVRIIPNERSFWNEFIPTELDQGVVSWGDTHADLSKKICMLNKNATICFGPEAGWDQSERERFKTLGAQAFSLGDRMYRLDVAIMLTVGAFIS